VTPEPVAATRFEPPVQAESAPFWEATRQRKLVVQWCTACDRGVFYPRSFCPHCGAGGDGALEWRPASGQATVHAAVVEHRPQAAGAAFSGGLPYFVALVDLDEGVRMLTNIVGCPPDEVRIGWRVSVTWEPMSDGRHLPLFEPEGGAGA
jgi:uncharacterized OB-fold protein